MNVHAPRLRRTLPAEVVSTEGIMSGEPCVAGTRVPAATIVAELRAGGDDELIFRHYPSLPLDGIEAVREWARSNGIDIAGS